MKRIGIMGLLLCIACGDDDDAKVEKDASRPGAPDASVDAGSRLDASTDARTPPAPTDAAVADDAAAVVDATTPDAGSPSLRASICGDKTDWPNPLPTNRAAKRVKDGFGFIEGPVWVRELGVLLFSDMNFNGGDAMGPPSQIRRLTPPSSFDVLQASSGSNGLALFAPTTLIAATHDTRSLGFVDAKTGARTPIAITYQNKKFNSPNDVTVRDDGWTYFTDPDWQLGGRQSELKTSVYRVQLSATTTTASAQLIDDSLDKPNGIALSPDQKTLYVGSSGDEIFKFDVAADGNVSGKTSFASGLGGSDGLGVDCAGNLYVTSGGVQVFAPDGAKLGTITVGDGPSNVAFGGPDSKTLYITARDSLYAIELNVPGFPY